MKKVFIFLAVIILLFGAVALLTKMQNEEKITEENPYGKSNLHPETIAQMDDPNYQNLILPDQLEKKLDKKEDVTVYFYSPTCSHCQRTTPVVSPLAKDMNINLTQFNLLEFENGWDQYGIKETPTIVQYKAGKEVNRITGYQEKEVFEKWFEENTK
ncbi:thioredoxin family protein [Cytobacillus solani]|uniref:Thioredoxin n=1 Tax=Cytobacillus solani TaxID=1637975 RepID=A0A0Q3QLJ2_9BACI|nr:thioredoxin family protein [Cytobacillus solani]KOP81565.1 thioredoxin [Bacillus sp. FJAT-21945]KQL18504.1 thioredoxin [Cytobacillus solani]USK56408.1 thioredoxin family protein [Cytobacillus solani]